MGVGGFGGGAYFFNFLVLSFRLLISFNVGE